MNNYSTIEEIRQVYPDKWVLLGDPKIEATNVLGGFVVFNADKLCRRTINPTVF